MKKDHILTALGIILFVTSYLFYTLYNASIVWDSLYFLKDYILVMGLFLYGLQTTENPTAKVVSFFSIIFVLFKAIYELLVFWEYIELNEEFTVDLLFLAYGILVWLIAITHTLRSKK